MPEARPAAPTRPPRPPGGGTAPAPEPLPLTTARRVAGTAAVAAGLLWTVKAAAILLGGAQPAALFELAPAVQGLAVAATSAMRGVGAFARMTAWTSAVLGLAVAAAFVTLPEHLAFNVLFLLANLAVPAALYLVGRRVRRLDLLGRRSRLPRRLALWTVPGVLLGGLLAEVREPLLEVPILLLGLGWIVLGVVLLGRRNRPAEPPAAAPVGAASARGTGAGRPGPRR